MATRAKEPTTRAGILAAGLVQIVRTPAELNESAGWWYVPRNAAYSVLRPSPDVIKAKREGLSPSLPHWLKPPVTPAEAVRRMFKDSDAEYRDAAKYVGGKRVKTPGEMSAAQLQSALGAIARRLRGEDASLEFEAA